MSDINKLKSSSRDPYPYFVAQKDFESLSLLYYEHIRDFFLKTFQDTLEKSITPPSFHFFDDEIIFDSQKEWGIYACYDRINNRICISRALLWKKWTAYEDISSWIWLYLIIAHEFGHALEELWELTMSNEEQEAFSDIFAGYAFRHFYTDLWSEPRAIFDAIYAFHWLWLASARISESRSQKNIHGDEKIRVHNFLDGYMCTPATFSRHIQQYARTRKQLKEVRNALLGIISQ